MAGRGTLLAEQLFISPELTDVLCLNKHLSEQLSAAQGGLRGEGEWDTEEGQMSRWTAITSSSLSFLTTVLSTW